MGRRQRTDEADRLWDLGGRLLYGGDGVCRNRRRAEALLRQSLQLAPNGEREWLFAWDLCNGSFGRERPAEAVTWFRRALRHGEKAAWASLAITLRDGGPGLAPQLRAGLAVAVRGWRTDRDAAAAAVAAETYDELEDHVSAARWWRIAAEAGNVGAMVSLGWHLRYGCGIARNPRAAAAWYRRAANTDDPGEWSDRSIAWWNLSICHRNGEGVRRDVAEEHRCLTRAAELGHDKARLRLAAGLLEGWFGVTDVAEGERRLRELALHDTAARLELGERLTTGSGLRKNTREGLAILRALARRGDGCAWVALGDQFHSGKHVRRDRRKSVHCYRRAARLGDESGWRNLGRCYADGEGVRKDARRARQCFLAAARLGDGDSACRLFDEIQAKDPARAAEILRPAVEEESPGAMIRMARLLREGRVAAVGRNGSRGTRVRAGRPSAAALAEARELLRLAKLHGADAAAVRAGLRGSADAERRAGTPVH